MMALNRCSSSSPRRERRVRYALAADARGTRFGDAHRVMVAAASQLHSWNKITAHGDGDECEDGDDGEDTYAAFSASPRESHRASWVALSK